MIRWLVILVMSNFCYSAFVIAEGDRIERFTALHSRYGAFLGLEEGAIFEEYVSELISEYEQFVATSGLNAPFRAENIPHYWVHAVLDAKLSPHIVEATKEFLRIGKAATEAETVAAFLLLDRLNQKEAVVNLWSDESSQMQFELLGRIFSGGSRYAEFATRIAGAVDSDIQVGNQVSPDSGFSLPMRLVVDYYLLDVIRENRDKYQELDKLISTLYLHTVADSIRGSINDDLLLSVHREFLAGKRDEHLSCSCRFEFAHTEVMARDFLNIGFGDCRVDRYRGLRTIFRYYPMLANQFLETLADSNKPEDLRVVLKFFDGPTFRSLDELPIVGKAVRTHLKSTKAEYLDGVQHWSITCAAFSEKDGGVDVPVSIKNSLAAETSSKLGTLRTEINRRCPRTFFSKSLEEAVRSMRPLVSGEPQQK